MGYIPMKTAYLLFISSFIVLSSCVIIQKSQSKLLSINKLKEEPWYFCNTDSLWTYDDYGNSILCTDYQKVTRLRVTNILGEIYFEGGSDGYCKLTDSVVIGKTLLVTASDLDNMAVPIDSLVNLQVLDLSRHHFFSFPYKVFQLPNLTALNIYNLCLHDYCEPCIYVDETYLKRPKESGQPRYVDSTDFDKYYRTDLKPHYGKMRTLKFINGDRYQHPNDQAIIDSINKTNNLENHWQIFECKDRMCNFQNYDEISEEEMVKVEIIWK